jgi:hypothetical protein
MLAAQRALRLGEAAGPLDPLELEPAR